MKMWMVNICASIILLCVCIFCAHVVLSCLWFIHLKYVPLLVGRTRLFHIYAYISPLCLCFLSPYCVMIYSRSRFIVSQGRKKLFHITVIVHPLYIWWCLKVVFMWWCMHFYFLRCLETDYGDSFHKYCSVWFFPLGSIVENYFSICYIFSSLCCDFICVSKKLWLCPLTCFLLLVKGVPNFWKNIPPMFLWIFFRLISCLYSRGSHISPSIMELDSTLRYSWSIISAGEGSHGMKYVLVQQCCIISSGIFCAWWVICVPFGER